MRRLAKRLGQLALAELLLIPLWSCDPFNAGFEDEEDALMARATTLTQADASPNTLTVMTWNVKFGGGRIDFFFDCHGDRSLMTKHEVLDNLAGLAAKIRQVDPDILLVQELDLMSKRGAYVNQLQYLLDHTSLNYAAYASQWRADYVPSDGIGQIDSGNAILSKYPIQNATRYALPLVEEQDGLTQYFYLKRNYMRATVQVPAAPLQVLNIHTDAFGKDGTKGRQIDIFKRVMDRLDDANTWFIAGGDLNTLPPGSTQIKDFPDSVCVEEDFQADNFEQERELLTPLYDRYTPAIALADYQANNAPYLTHTTRADGFWNRKLDYLFTNGPIVPGSGLTHQDATSGGMATMPLSDHAPVTVTLEVRR